MAAISRANIRLAGSHAGVSIGEDGPSQMALEDLAMMRAVCGSTVFYPSDGVSGRIWWKPCLPCPAFLTCAQPAKRQTFFTATMKSLKSAAARLKKSANDKATIVACGITLHESLKAYDELKKSGIDVRIIDAYSVKPIDAKALNQASAETKALIVVEDHFVEGGLGDAVLDAFAGSNTPLPRIIKLAVRSMPGSGKPQELLDAAGISARHIVEAVLALK